MTIGGRAVHGAASFDIIDPATGRVIAQAPDASAEQLDAAVEAARNALPGWSARPWRERQALLGAIAKVYIANQEELARLLTREQGKPLARARSEVAVAAYWYAEFAKMELADLVLQDTPQAYVAVRRVPVGVIGAMVPWNYPVVLAAWKIAPGLLAGNTMVLKPSPFTPLVTLRLGELLRDVLPPGVLNIVSGGDALGPLMSEHPGFDKLSFTGSSATGRSVMRSASGGLKRLTLELGGNDAAIVMPDVDVDAVAKELFWGAFVNSGQICIAAKRIYIHEAIYERMAQAFVALAECTRMGPGEDEGVELGPVQNRRQFDRLRDLLADCRRRGLKLLCGGEPAPGPGLFFPVTLVDNPPDDSRIVREEPFGPILPLLRFSDVDEVVARANASEYGLAGSVWCRDEAQALAIARRLETGTVWINEIQTASPHKPMAGHKQSGLGVENGQEGLMSYTQPQTISVRRAG
jgi:acyl-CoA reductase-like NAD-dependent aldehyde dehydrogenase